MQKSGGVRILMQLDFNEERFYAMMQAPALQPFAPEVISFLNKLSLRLLQVGRSYSDVITFAYWCRKAAVLSYAKEYKDAAKRLGRGIVFHIAPSNVPVNFAFSLAAGLLAGNKNIVRIPSKDFPQVRIICTEINNLLSEYPDMLPYIYLVKYEKGKEYTSWISSRCNVRVIWGGDSTIAEIRKSLLAPRAFDVTFADRYSACIINSDYYLALDNKEQVALDFYNDTYFSDQNACTSPRIILWNGTHIEEAKRQFWMYLSELVDQRYNLAPVQAVGKWDALCLAAMNNNCSLIKDDSGLNIMRLKVKELSTDLLKYQYHSGFFFEYDLTQMDDIIPICQEKCQTLAYLGDMKEEIQTCLIKTGVPGVDRIVPLGRTMDFSLIWDGYDLIRTLSRIIYVY